MTVYKVELSRLGRCGCDIPCSYYDSRAKAEEAVKALENVFSMWCTDKAAGGNIIHFMRDDLALTFRIIPIEVH